MSEVIAVEEPQTGPDAVQFTATKLFTRPGPDEALTWNGNLPLRASRAPEEAGYDVRELLDGGGARARPVRAVRTSTGSGSTTPRPRKARTAQ